MRRFFFVTISVVRSLAGVVLKCSWRDRFALYAALERECVPLCTRLGGAFPKAGQILSTRADLLPARICAALAQLQDDMPPLPDEVTARVLTPFCTQGRLEAICLEPVASATVAQVHQASLVDGGRRVALKVLRPGVARSLRDDCQIFRFVGRFVALLPVMASVPVNEALEEVSQMLMEQTKFREEAHKHQRLRQILSAHHGVLVPALHAELCTEHVLVMEFVPDMRKLTDPELPADLAREALTNGLRALYTMIFDAGFVHCDLHPGNMLVAMDGRLVILDAGCIVELTESTRVSFAEFFLAIALRDGRSAARIVRETATRLPADLKIDQFDREIAALIERMGGLRAREFQVTGFVGELFAIQRRHGIYGTSRFTMIILALLVFEGVAKQRYPDLDFQQEAIPYVIQALARKSQ